MNKIITGQRQDMLIWKNLKRKKLSVQQQVWFQFQIQLS